MALEQVAVRPEGYTENARIKPRTQSHGPVQISDRIRQSEAVTRPNGAQQQQIAKKNLAFPRFSWHLADMSVGIVAPKQL